jgi:hypothetical protein
LGDFDEPLSDLNDAGRTSALGGADMRAPAETDCGGSIFMEFMRRVPVTND